MSHSVKLNYTAGYTPTASELAVGGLAYNVVDEVLYTKLNDNSVIAISSGGDEGGTYVLKSGDSMSGALAVAVVNMTQNGIITFDTDAGEISKITGRQGGIDIHSDSTVVFKESDSDVDAVIVSTNNKTVTASGGFIGPLTGNADTATKWSTARTFDIVGDVTGSGVSFDGSSNLTFTAVVGNDSHTHTRTVSAGAADTRTYASFGVGLAMSETSGSATGQGTSYGAILSINHNANRGFQLAGNKPGDLFVRGIEAGATDSFGNAGFNDWREIVTTVSGKATDSEKLDGLDSTAFLAAGAKAADSEKLDGLDSTAFLAVGGEAVTAAWADQVDVNGGNTSSSYYDIVWHSGDSLYSGTKLEAQASTGNLRTAGSIITTIATGTAPLTVASTTKVTNLNADLLDGYSATEDDTASTIAVRNGSGDINARLFRSDYQTESSIGASATMCFRNSTSDNYLRHGTRTAVADFIHGANYFIRGGATDYHTATLYTRGYLVAETAYRDRGIYGTYDSGKTQHIWSMGTGYKNSATGADFGNLYGMAYKYNGSAGGHGQYCVQNGNATAGWGSNIWTSGNVTAYSDRRVKKNIKVIPDALEKISQLSGYTFDRIDTPDADRQTGVIAQEVRKVLPEAVIEGHDDDKTLSVAYGNMVGLLIEGIKELEARIKVLEKR